MQLEFRRQTGSEYIAHTIKLALRPEMPFTAQAETVKEDWRFRANEYIENVLGYKLWKGTVEHPGQYEIVEAYELALKQQHERLLYEAGRLRLDELRDWQPGQVIKNHLHLAGGHGFGKTFVAALLVRHFYDNFLPGVTYLFAPTLNQIKSLIWKEVGTITKQSPLPYGRLLEDCEIKDVSNHFVEGRAVPAGDDTEGVQGQHEAHQMLATDESEGVGVSFWKAREALIAGGISIVLMMGNPKTRTSNFYQMAADPRCAVFVLSCLYHPNVLLDREVVPSAVRRDYVETMLRDHCSIVAAHDVDKLTFEVAWRPGVIYQPDHEFQWRVMGVAPAEATERNLISIGRYEGAVKRLRESYRPDFASIGVDCAWEGLDKGTVYVRHDGAVWRHSEIKQKQPSDYYFSVKDAAKALREKNVLTLEIRVDAGGGYASGMLDYLQNDAELRSWFISLKLIKVYFGSVAVKDKDNYFDVVTEMEADVAETLKSLKILNAPNELKQDLCLREWEPRNVRGRLVKKLVDKTDFKKKHGRSPDDGDGMKLAVASPHLFDDDEWGVD